MALMTFVSDDWLDDVLSLLYDLQCVGLVEECVDRNGTTFSGENKAELIDWLMSMGDKAGLLLNANNSPASGAFLLN
jgi:hypothetical protein